jgi:hypothetical protein
MIGFEANDPPTLERDDVTGHGAVIVAILRGEVVPVEGEGTDG